MRYEQEEEAKITQGSILLWPPLLVLRKKKGGGMVTISSGFFPIFLAARTKKQLRCTGTVGSSMYKGTSST